MIQQLTLPLVNWSLGTGIILFFAVVCLALIIMVSSMIHSGRKKEE